MQIFKCLIQAIIQKNADFLVFNPGNNTKNADFLVFYVFLQPLTLNFIVFDNSGSAHRSFADPYGEISYM